MAKNETKAKAAEGAATETVTVTTGKKEAVESRWTMELCLRFARRFDTEQAWATGAPSSYKAAVARGFHAKCTAHMSQKAAPRVVGKKVAKTSTKKKATTKKGSGRAA